MSKIFITAKNGFIGSSLVKSLTHKYEVISTCRSTLDLTNKEMMRNFFQKNNFDVIINTASMGGQKGHSNNPQDLYNNLAITFNLLRFRNPKTALFNLSSGYELDYDGDYGGQQRTLSNYYPLDCYGMSKNIISRICETYSNVYTFRIYGIYGETQPDDRWIKKVVIDYINNGRLSAYINRKVDFVYINDLVKLINYYISNLKNEISLSPQVDISLLKKYETKDILNIINNLDKHKVDIFIEDSTSSDYIGDGKLFSSLVPDYVPLEQGLLLIYNSLLKK